MDPDDCVYNATEQYGPFPYSLWAADRQSYYDYNETYHYYNDTYYYDFLYNDTYYNYYIYNNTHYFFNNTYDFEHHYAYRYEHLDFCNDTCWQV